MGTNIDFRLIGQMYTFWRTALIMNIQLNCSKLGYKHCRSYVVGTFMVGTYMGATSVGDQANSYGGTAS